jgi:hypothetical protein
MSGAEAGLAGDDVSRVVEAVFPGQPDEFGPGGEQSGYRYT